MESQLVRYVGGREPVPLADRQVARRGKRLYDDTRLAAMEAEAAVILTEYMMEEYTKLDARRKELAGDDMNLNMSLCQLQAGARFQLVHIQKSHRWGF